MAERLGAPAEFETSCFELAGDRRPALTVQTEAPTGSLNGYGRRRSREQRRCSNDGVGIRFPDARRAALHQDDRSFARPPSGGPSAERALPTHRASVRRHYEFIADETMSRR